MHVVCRLRAVGKPFGAAFANYVAGSSRRSRRPHRLHFCKANRPRSGWNRRFVDCAGDVPVVLRVGAVSLEELQAVVPATKIDIRSGQETPRSPGVTHRHYSPRAKVQVYGSSGTGIRSLPLPVLTDRAAFIGLNPPGGKTELDLICSSVDEYAHELFEFFARVRPAGIETIYCEQVDEKLALEPR